MEIKQRFKTAGQAMMKGARHRRAALAVAAALTASAILPGCSVIAVQGQPYGAVTTHNVAIGLSPETAQTMFDSTSGIPLVGEVIEETFRGRVARVDQNGRLVAQYPTNYYNTRICREGIKRQPDGSYTWNWNKEIPCYPDTPRPPGPYYKALSINHLRCDFGYSLRTLAQQETVNGPVTDRFTTCVRTGTPDSAISARTVAAPHVSRQGRRYDLPACDTYSTADIKLIGAVRPDLPRDKAAICVPMRH